MKANLLLWSAIATLFLASCETPSSEVGGVEKISVEFAESEVVIPVGEESSVLLNISPAEYITEVEVQISDNSVAAIKSLTPTDSALIVEFESAGIGTTTCVAVCGDVIATCTVRVDPISVQSIALNKSSLLLPVYGTEVLSASILPENATNPSIIWSSEDESIATVSGGVVKAIAPGSTKITARSAGCSASCDVEVVAINAESIAFDITTRNLKEKESFLVTATILPENTTYMNVEWSLSADDVVSYELIDAVDTDNIIAAKLTALKAGNVTISAQIGGLTASCEVTVEPAEVPLADPKVGDYFYSDGTWSDGGLISIKKDGTSPVWAEVKPAPLPGKTVIGIVFSTDTERISSSLANEGYTKGLVMCTHLAHAPGAKLTKYSFDESVSCIGNHKLGTSWYSDLFGYDWTATILQTYMGKVAQCPAFDWTTTDFSPAAPSNTSDWFVPSIGQLWDMMANLAGEEVAIHLKNLRSYEYDITYGMDVKLTYDPIAKLNSCMSLVPANQKEDFVISRANYSGSDICELMSSTLYDNSDGCCCIFWLGTKGEFEPLAGWVNDDMVCRPILAF